MKHQHDPLILIDAMQAQLDLLRRQIQVRYIPETGESFYPATVNATAKHLQGLSYSLYNATRKP